PIIIFAVILSCCTLSMGVYTALVREGFASMVLRTLVSFFLLGCLALYLLNLIFGAGVVPQSLIFCGVILATLLVFVARWVFIQSEEHTSELQSRENLVCR